MPENDRVLIEIITAANMAGVEQAKAGFLGLTPATLALAATLAIVVTVGKVAIENYKAQQDAALELAQAVGVYNAQVGKTIPTSAAATKAADAASKAQDSLTIAYNFVQLAQLAYTDAVHKHGAKSEIAFKATLHLQDANIRLKQAQEALTDSQTALTDAHAGAAPVIQGAAIDLAKLNGQFDTWLQNNKQYVPSQYDAKTALASFVRAGSDATESMRMLNDALDLSAIRHESVADAAKTLILAEAGNSKGLRDLGITTAEYNAIMKSTLSDADKHAALLALVETRTAHGRDTTDSLSQSQHNLNTDWQTFTASIGPGVTTGLETIYAAADVAVGALQQLQIALVGVANDNQFWADLQNNILTAGVYGAAKNAASGVPGPANYGAAVHARPRVASPVGGTTLNTTVYVNGANMTNDQVGAVIARNLRRIGQV